MVQDPKYLDQAFSSVSLEEHFARLEVGQTFIFRVDVLALRSALVAANSTINVTASGFDWADLTAKKINVTLLELAGID